MAHLFQTDLLRSQPCNMMMCNALNQHNAEECVNSFAWGRLCYTDKDQQQRFYPYKLIQCVTCNHTRPHRYIECAASGESFVTPQCLLCMCLGKPSVLVKSGEGGMAPFCELSNCITHRYYATEWYHRDDTGFTFPGSEDEDPDDDAKKER